jgi:TolB-like protein/DNA-binding winged helix-turn-helix (wHTH) protein/Tfp pilus assembly protein PilF
MLMAEQFQKRYRLGEFEIDVDKRLLKRKNKAVHLAHKPFDVLLYLIENRDRLVKRDELLEHFWDGCDVYDVNLSKCVGAIRKALGERHDSSRFIETRWAEGYRYIGPLDEEAMASLPLTDTQQSNANNISVTESRPENFAADKTSALPVETLGAEPVSFTERLRQIKTSRPVLFGIFGALVLLLISGATLMIYRFPSRPTEKTPVRSVAVLPLKNLSGDQANEYFSDGLTESLITALSKIDGLKVISRSSVFRFKGKDVAPEEVGKILGVAAVLEGSIKRDNDYLQATVRLVSVEDGSVLWASEVYERSIGDIFALQDEIARNIAAGLRVRLSGVSEARLAKRYTDNVEAYQLYLKGRYFWNKRTIENLKKSTEYYEQAIAKDPKYALAYTGLADCYQLLAEYDATTPKEGFTKARAAATKALEIDDQLAEAHTSLAYTLSFYEWDWASAEKEFKRALELNPNYITAHQWYSEYLVAMGRFDEALDENKRALQLDPTSLIVNIDLISYYYMTRQFDLAIQHSHKVIEMDPNFAYGYVFLSFSLGQKGMKQEAAEAYIKSVELFGEVREAEELRKTLTRIGVKAMWLRRLEQVDTSAKRETFSAQWRALFYIWIGDKDKALDWLDRALERRDRWIINMKYSPEMDSLRSEPRFQDLLRRINL